MNPCLTFVEMQVQHVQESKPSIMFDLDDATNDFVETWLNRYNEKYNDTLKFEDIHTWDIASCAKKDINRSQFFEVLDEPGFYSTVTPHKDAVRVIEWLTQYFDVFIVTASSHSHIPEKIEWIKKHFPFIKECNIWPMNQKWRLNIDYLVDDGLHNHVGFKGQSIVFNRPWNMNQLLPLAFIRVNNYLDIENYFKSFINSHEQGE